MHFLRSGLNLSLLIRLVSLTLTLACIFFLPETFVAFFFIALGLGHFSLAFWYQKGTGRWKLPATSLLLLSFAILAFVVNATSTGWFFVLTGIYTSLHMAWDEVHLLKGTHSLFTTLELAPFVILYGGLLIDANFGTMLFFPTLALSITSMTGYIAMSVFCKRVPNGVSFVNLGWGVFAFLVYLSYLASSNVPAYLWFLGLAVIHYFIWYGEYARKVAGNPERRKTYYVRVALVNGTLFAALSAWVSGLLPIGGIIFIPTFFYVWAFLHVTTSTRPKDVSRMFSLR